MASGKAVGVVFDSMHRPSEILTSAVKLPRLERATYRHATLSAASIKPLTSASRLTEITIEEPSGELPEEAIAAFAELKSLKRLVLRGVMIGEDVEFALRQRLPEVEVVVEPPREAVPNESRNAAAQAQVKVGLVW
jgi:hypothetical protein